MWNCDKIRDVLPLAVENDLPAAGMEAVRVHLTRCDGCAVEMARYRKSTEALHAYSASIGRSIRTDGLWAGIEASLGGSEAPARGRVIPFPRRWSSLVRDFAAVAAVFAVGIGLGFWVTNRPSGASSRPADVGIVGPMETVNPMPGLSPFVVPVSTRPLPSNYVLRNFTPPALSGEASGVIDTVEIPLPARPHFRIEQAHPVEDEDVELRF